MEDRARTDNLLLFNPKGGAEGPNALAYLIFFFLFFSLSMNPTSRLMMNYEPQTLHFSQIEFNMRFPLDFDKCGLLFQGSALCLNNGRLCSLIQFRLLSVFSFI